VRREAQLAAGLVVVIVGVVGQRAQPVAEPG
jgi:hypothetical protein